MRTYSPQSVDVQGMFGSIAKRYDLANRVLSLGIDRYWRWRMLRHLELPESEQVLDLCTGTGDLLFALRKRVSYAGVVGVDFCYPMLEQARLRFDSEDERFLAQGDALQLPFADQQFDAVTVAFGVRNFNNLEAGLSEILRVLRRGGQLLVLEFGRPKLPVFAQVFRCYSTFLMPRIGEFLTGNRAAYEYLPDTAEHFPCGEEFAAVLRRTGFEVKKIEMLTLGIAFMYVAIGR